MIFPFAPVVDRSRGCLVSIDVVCDLRRIVTKCANSCDKKQWEPRPRLHGHATKIENTSRSRRSKCLPTLANLASLIERIRFLVCPCDKVQSWGTGVCRTVEDVQGVGESKVKENI